MIRIDYVRFSCWIPSKEINIIAQTKIGDAHGLYRVFVGLVNTTGYNYGTSGVDIAEGTQVAPYLIRYAQGAEMGLPARTNIDFTGGDVWTGSYLYGITSLGTFDLTLSTVEADLIAFTGGSSVDQTTNTRHTAFSDNITLPTPPQVWMMTVFRLQSKETGSKGANKFITLIAPRMWLSPTGIAGAPSFQAAGTYGFTIVPTVGDRYPWGLPFSSTALDLSEDETPILYVITDNPTHTVGFIAQSGNASETITLPFKPVPANYDYSTPDTTTDPVQVYVDGVAIDATSVNTTNGQVVVPAPDTTFAGGEYIGIFYETNYESVV